MKEKRPRKSGIHAAAVALGRVAQRQFTAQQRSERGRAAVLTRWRKQKMKRYHVLVALDDPNHPQIIDSDLDRAALLKRTKARKDYWSRSTFIDYVEYDPGKFTITREFAPDADAQVKALSTVLQGARQ